VTPLTILDALDDPQLFAAAFGDAATWTAWRAFLAALFALPMPSPLGTVYGRHTGRERLPMVPAREAWCIVGRRGGKSRVAALVAVYLAAFRSYEAVLAPGEHGTLPIIAADRRQARTVMRYVVGLLEGCPMLARMITGRTAESVTLASRVTIEVHTASFRAVRGYTVVAAVLDEVAFWRSEDSANPDVEIVGALRPAMATVPGALLLAISSPYARRGVLWQAYRDHYGKHGPVLVWQAPSQFMNPTIPEAIIAAAYEVDASAAAAEYGAEFRRDLEAYVSREVVEACTVPGRHGVPPVAGERYCGFVDPSGGSADAFTLAIAHAEDRDGTRHVVLDYVSETRPPFSPEAVVSEYAAACRSYRVSAVTGDRYAGEWPREAFARHGVTYQPSAQPKGELYAAFLPLLNSGRVELHDNRRLAAQLLGLERRTARGGRDAIDHPPNGHDDLANAVAGVCVLALGPCEDGYLGFMRLDAAARAARVQAAAGETLREAVVGGVDSGDERERRLAEYERLERLARRL